MKKYQKYDEEEKALISQIGDNYPQNLMEGFKELAAKFDRTPYQISAEYYYLKKKEATKKNYSFILASKKTIVPDRKIVRDGCPIKPKKGKLSIKRLILKFLGIEYDN